MLPDPVPVVAAAAVDAVDVNVGSTNAVAILSQLKHAVWSAKPVPVSANDDPIFAADTRVANAAGTANVALAYRPMSRFAAGTMFVNLGKMCERNPVTELEEFRDSQWAFTLLRDEMETERAGRSRKAPASKLPALERMSTPRRTRTRRPRERVRATLSKEAAKGMAVIFD